MTQAMPPSPFGRRILGQSPALLNLLNAASLVALSRAPVLVTGESGSGKRLLARAMHEYAGDGTLHPLECQEAEDLGGDLGPGDTLYLDEVGALAPRLQGRLLELLDTPARGAPRVIAATRVDLAVAVERGGFSPELYHRLNVVPLAVPPLRERREDIAPLLEAFSGRLAARRGLAAPRYSAEALGRLQRYPWPGNVRELQALAERTTLLLPGARIGPDNLPEGLRRLQDAAGEGFRLPEAGVSLARVEAQLIAQALERSGGNRSRAARLLGLTRDTLLYRMRKHAIGG